MSAGLETSAPCWYCDPTQSWARGVVLAHKGSHVVVRSDAGGAELELPADAAHVVRFDETNDSKVHADMTGESVAPQRERVRPRVPSRSISRSLVCLCLLWRARAARRFAYFRSSFLSPSLVVLFVFFFFFRFPFFFFFFSFF